MFLIKAALAICLVYLGHPYWGVVVALISITYTRGTHGR